MAVNDPRRPDFTTKDYVPLRPRTDLPETTAFGTDEVSLRRVSGLINLAALAVNGMIALRFVLKLMAANPGNPFAALVYFLAHPLWRSLSA